MSVIECDVLVVGAGPAGAVAALYCSKNGLDTVLIEKNDKVGGHTNLKIDASPDFELTEIIEELNLKTENLVYNSKWHSPSGNSFTLRSKVGEYYFKRSPDRDSFECSTVDRAVDHGCRLILGVTIEEVSKSDGKFSEVVISQDDEKIVIRPRIIIASDGRNSHFHKYITDTQIDKKKREGYGVTGKDFVNPETSEIYFDAELVPGGYFYIVTCHGGMSSAAIVLDSDKITKPAKEYFDEYLSRNPTVADKIKSNDDYFVGQGSLFKLDRHVYGNLIFVGDAGGFLDPLMGYGMMPAIVSAYYAGKCSAEAIGKNDLQALKKYEGEMKKRFNEKSQYLCRKMFDSMNNRDFDLIIKMANELDDRIDIDGFLHRPNIKVMCSAFFVFCKNLPGSARVLFKSVT